MLLYSKLPVRHPRIRFLITDDVPSIFASVSLPSGAAFDLICLHPRPPRPDIQQDATERDAELLIVARKIFPTRDESRGLQAFTDWAYTFQPDSLLG
jgi:hypothetical protein